MSADQTQLTARFKQGFDLASAQVLTVNKPSTAVDKSKPWCRFKVAPGERRREENGPTPRYLQLGGIFLQVFVPKQLGAAGGDVFIDAFDDLFCDWVSADGALQMGRMTRNDAEQDDHYQVTIRFAYQSLRSR